MVGSMTHLPVQQQTATSCWHSDSASRDSRRAARHSYRCCDCCQLPHTLLQECCCCCHGCWCLAPCLHRQWSFPCLAAQPHPQHCQLLCSTGCPAYAKHQLLLMLPQPSLRPTSPKPLMAVASGCSNMAVAPAACCCCCCEGAAA